MKNKITDMLAMPVIKNNERTKVMLECATDAERDYSGKYKKELIAFLCSLGFDAALKDKTSDEIIIDGVKIEGDFSQAATIGTMGYSRERVVRKKRQIVLSAYSFDKASKICTIPINMPIDKLQLTKKIADGIKAKADRIASIDKMVSDREEFLAALFNRYVAVDGMKSINVEKGALTLNITDLGSITVGNDGNITGCDITMPEIKTLEDVKNFPMVASDIKTRALVAEMQIKKLGATGVTESSPEGRACLYEGKISF